MAQRTVTTELPVELWQFAADVSKLVEPARVEYLNRVLAGEDENTIIREWYALHNQLKSLRRHQYFTLSNRELEVTPACESKDRLAGKRQRTSRGGASPQRNRKATVSNTC